VFLCSSVSSFPRSCELFLISLVSCSYSHHWCGGGDVWRLKLQKGIVPIRYRHHQVQLPVCKYNFEGEEGQTKT